MQTNDESDKTLSDYAVTDPADERWKARELRAIGRIIDLGEQSMQPYDLKCDGWRQPHIRICRGLIECTREYAVGDHVCGHEMLVVLHKCAEVTVDALQTYVNEPLLVDAAKKMRSLTHAFINGDSFYTTRAQMRAFRRATDSLLVRLQGENNVLCV
jgi:hypothetical protein